MTKTRLISLTKITITSLLVIFSVYFSVWKVDIDELGQSFQTANYWLAAALVPVILVSHYIRAHRWKVILRFIHPTAHAGRLFAGVIVGYFMNNLIPRSGELARPYVTAQRERDVKFSSLLGTIVIERFIDIVSLLVIVAVVLLFDQRLFEGFEEFGVNEAAMKSMVLPAVLIGVVFLVIAPSSFGMRLVKWIVQVVPSSFRTRIVETFQSMQAGFGAIKSIPQAGVIVGETALLYFCYMLPLFMMFFAFESGARVSPTMFDAVKILALTAMAFAVAPTPGAFGIFHVTARIAVMKILDFSYADAVAYATITHFVNYITVMIPGGYYLLRYNISFRELTHAKDKTETSGS